MSAEPESKIMPDHEVQTYKNRMQELVNNEELVSG